MMTLRGLRLAVWGLVACAALALGGYSLWRQMSPDVPATAGLIAPSDQIGGPFRLIDAATGAVVTEADLKGKATGLFFGFTHCPDVCPTTLTDATQWLEALGPDAEKIRLYMVTVDPERDTAEVMKNYLSSFDGRIGALTGSREEIDRIIKAYRVYARKVPTKDGDYTMDHTAGVYLMNRDLKFVGMVSYKDDKAKAVERLKALVRNG